MSDAASPDPRAYIRVADMLRQQIQSGSLGTGDPVPSITTLCRDQGRARGTIRKAMELRDREGLIQRRLGTGYHVR